MKTFERKSTLTFVALATLYLFWGSSYVANQICLRSIPPLSLMSMRFISAGGILLVLASILKPAAARASELLIACLSGIFLVGSNTVIAIAQGYMPSSAVATIVATMPLWALLLSSGLKQSGRLRETRPAVIAFIGIAVLAFGWRARYPLWPSLALLIATAIWAATSVWIGRAGLPMTARTLGAQMFSGGIAVFLLALTTDEKIAGFSSLKTEAAFAFLVLGPSLLAYAAYNFLLRTTKTTIATSYAFVCPVIATLLGVFLLRERPVLNQYLGLALILAGLADLFLGRAKRQVQANQVKSLTNEDLAA